MIEINNMLKIPNKLLIGIKRSEISKFLLILRSFSGEVIWNLQKRRFKNEKTKNNPSKKSNFTKLFWAKMLFAFYSFVNYAFGDMGEK